MSKMMDIDDLSQDMMGLEPHNRSNDTSISNNDKAYSRASALKFELDHANRLSGCEECNGDTLSSQEDGAERDQDGKKIESHGKVACCSVPGDLDTYKSTDFRMFRFKVEDCPFLDELQDHDWTECPFAHPGEKARRRDPRKYKYGSTACPDFRKGTCKRGEACHYAHGVFESWLHPAKYRTQLCKDAGSCARLVCFFAHTLEELRAPEAGSKLAAPMLLAPNPRDLSVSSVASSINGLSGTDEWGSFSSLSPPPPSLLTAGLGAMPDLCMGGSNSRDPTQRNGSAFSPSAHLNPLLSPGGVSAVASILRAAQQQQQQQQLQQQQQHMMLQQQSDHSLLSGLMETLRLQQESKLPRLASASAHNSQVAYGPGLLHSNQVPSGFYSTSPPGSPPLHQQAVLTPTYSPVPSYAAPPPPPPPPPRPAAPSMMPDLTHPLLAGALQAGVLHQVLAQLSPQQLALLTQQQHAPAFAQQPPVYHGHSPMPSPCMAAQHFGSGPGLEWLSAASGPHMLTMDQQRAMPSLQNSGMDHFAASYPFFAAGPWTV